MKNFKQPTLLLTGLLSLVIVSCKKNSDTTPAPAPVLPVINSFSPATGSAGTTVTISGKNFSPAIANDVVSFNGTAATVTSATADQIIVTVPNDAATGKITVKISSNTAASMDNFTVTLNQLSEARSRLVAAATGNKILFAGGEINFSQAVKTVDIFDISTNTWSTAQLSEERGYLVDFTCAALGTKILFGGSGGGSRAVDIYDININTWSTAQLSEARFGLAAAAAGNKVVFAGGVTTSVSKTVDIYHVSTNSLSTAQLSEARSGLAAAAAGNKILFAGGNNEFNDVKTVDIYDVSTSTWSTAQLSEARSGLVAAATGNKVVFAGGSNGTLSKSVDIYDASTNTWTIAQLSEAREGLAAAAAGSKVLFAGGMNNNIPSKTVDIYDVVSNTWSTAQLSEARWDLAGAGTGNKIVFGGGSISAGKSKTVDIYDVQTGMWYH